MNANRTYKDDDARYTDAPAEVDAALDYAIEHNRFLTQEQFFDLLKNGKRGDVSLPKRRMVSARRTAYA